MQKQAGIEQAPQKSVLKNPTVLKLGLVSLFADISSEMLYPITPIFLTSVLGASMASLGLVEGVAEAAASLLKSYSGRLSDRVGKRKPFVVSGYLLSALAKPIIGLATIWGHVLFARVLDRIGKGLRSAPRDALIAEAVPAENRGAAFGWHRGMDTLGAAIGPILTLILIGLFSLKIRSLYFLALIPGLASVLVARLVSDSAVPKKSAAANAAPEEDSFSPALRRYFLAWTIFSLANSSDVFLLMRTKELGFSLSQLILFYCLYSLSYSLLSPYFGKLSDGRDRRSLISFSLLIFAAVYAGFSVATRGWHLFMLFSLYGLYMAASDGVGKALVVDLAEPESKASALGFFGTVTGLATIFASFVAGTLWDRSGSSFTFLYGAAGALISILVLQSVKVKPGESGLSAGS